MMNSANEGGRNSSRYPFTATQWQELEQQALVYKYMISGIPIPPHLLFTIKQSLDSSTKLMLQQHSPHPSIGWNCFQVGFGRKIDPEPGRCRRTDGKKWRCSKEAYPDSKYCERHMHRGRNRSRKPVEVSSMTTPKTPPKPIPNFPSSKSPNHPSNVLSSQDHFLLDSSPYRLVKIYGMKEQVDEHSFFSESSGIIKTSMGDSKQKTFPEYHQNRYSYQEQQDQGFYYDHLGLEIERKDEPQKVMHHFFDEWPPNGDNNKDYSTTQLSISIPSTASDFFLAHNDK
ncbi:hypothetical protein SSX86_009770 [Deinandra increscens subsp. villosa]|uniref:Growth-regulating factor n=1 Tax=Deinandra increscens subsp. villosa TaxID=3103831 RepID=A0AAP0H4C4_9ASTR